MSWYSRSRRSERWSLYPVYVPVAERRAQAEAAKARATKRGEALEPVQAFGRTLATSVWGRAWCEHVEGFQDYSYRLDRGRSYLRNGAVIDLRLEPARVSAKVQGSDLYQVTITAKKLPPERWRTLVAGCTGRIGSTLELLAGKLSDAVMTRLTDPREGLFPRSGELAFDCTCPDVASMCKHVAATLLGVGVRLDDRPELLFTLRGVEHAELVAAAGSAEAVDALSRGESPDMLRGEDLGATFGIELDEAPPAPPTAGPTARTARETKPARPRKAAPRKHSAKPLDPDVPNLETKVFEALEWLLGSLLVEVPPAAGRPPAVKRGRARRAGRRTRA